MVGFDPFATSELDRIRKLTLDMFRDEGLPMHLRQGEESPLTTAPRLALGHRSERHRQRGIVLWSTAVAAALVIGMLLPPWKHESEDPSDHSRAVPDDDSIGIAASECRRGSRPYVRNHLRC